MEVTRTKVFVEPIKIPPKYPDTVDWRIPKPPVVSPVRHQKKCCCCWAMTPVLVTESMKKLQYKEKELQILSPQKLVDCVLPNPSPEKTDPDTGCYIHSVVKAFDWWKKHTVPTEESYPFNARKGPCLPSEGGVMITTYKEISGFKRKKILKMGIYDGPDPVESASAASSSTPTDIEDKSDSHALAIIGYGTDEATRKNYWLVQSSWGERWGDKGVGKINRDVMINGRFLLRRISYPFC
ncbi:hypothetical protein PTKIN_Ptkin19aG0073300 [Pterospermum kingtungense]